MHVSTLPALNFMSHCMLGKTFYVHTRNKELFCEKRSKPLAVKLQFPAYPYIATQALFHVCWWPECRTISAEIAAQSALELQQIFHRYRIISCRRYIFIVFTEAIAELLCVPHGRTLVQFKSHLYGYILAMVALPYMRGLLTDMLHMLHRPRTFKYHFLDIL